MQMWPPHWPPQTAAARNAPDWRLSRRDAYQSSLEVLHRRGHRSNDISRLVINKRVLVCPCYATDKQTDGRTPASLKVPSITWRGLPRPSDTHSAVRESSQHRLWIFCRFCRPIHFSTCKCRLLIYQFRLSLRSRYTAKTARDRSIRAIRSHHRGLYSRCDLC